MRDDGRVDSRRRRRRHPLRRAVARADHDAFAAVAAHADVILLAGDLTTHGAPEQAAVLADAYRPLEVPVYAVLGNHDFHANRCDEVIPVLEDAGIRILQARPPCTRSAGWSWDRRRQGVRRRVPRRGAARLRRAAAAPGLRRDDARGRRDRGGLEAISGCHRRIVLLHYAPSRRRSSASRSRSGPSSARRGSRADRRTPARPRPARPRPPGSSGRARPCPSATSPST